MIVSLVPKCSKEKKIRTEYIYPCPKFSNVQSRIPDPHIRAHNYTRIRIWVSQQMVQSPKEMHHVCGLSCHLPLILCCLAYQISI